MAGQRGMSSDADCPECEVITGLTKRDNSRDRQCSSCGNWWTFHIDFDTEKQDNRMYRIVGIRRYYGPIKCRQRRCAAQAKFKTTDRGAKRRYKCAAHSGECIIA